MRRLKRYVRLLAMVLVITLLVPMTAPMTKVYAAESEENRCYSVALGDGAYLRLEETASTRTALYYLNGKITQRAVYNKESGEILYYDLSQASTAYGIRMLGIDKERVVRYNIDDFIVADEAESVAYVRNLGGSVQTVAEGKANYSFLKSETYTFDGVDYCRGLYGYSSSRQYKENYWYFAGGLAVSVVATVLGAVFTSASVAISIAGTAAGTLISALSVTDWMRESFWRYKFSQWTPNYVTFECSNDYVYRKERLLEINNENMGEWKTVYEKAAWEIEAERDAILKSPGLY